MPPPPVVVRQEPVPAEPVPAAPSPGEGGEGSALVAVFMVLRRVLVGLLLLNLIAAAIVDFREQSQLRSPPRDPRVDLPNFPDPAFAEELWKENLQSVVRDYAPFVEFKYRPMRARFTNIDEAGRRSIPGPPPASPQGVIRFFGGSTTWGVGAQDSETFPAIVSRLEPRYRVVNESASAYTSRQGLSRLINLLNQDEPVDLAIFYDGVNDIVFSCNSRLSMNPVLGENWIMARLDASPGSELRRFFSQGQLVMDFLRASLRPGKGPVFERCNDPAGAERVASTVINNWKMARQLVTARGGDFIAVLQPVSFVGSPRVDHLAALPDSFANFHMKPSPGLQVVYQRMWPILQRRLREEQLDWALDFSDAFDGSEPIYVDWAHVTGRGNELIARRLHPYIRRILAARARR
jgi:hypothetical protein